MKTRAVFLIVVVVSLAVGATSHGAAVAVVSGGDTYLVADNGIVSAAGTAVTSDPVDTNTDHYSEPGQFGGQDVGQPDSWNGDRRWGDDGDATSALYEFTGLTNGTYNVFSSWRNVPQANLGLAHYSVSDGGPTIDLDQTVGATALSALVLNDGTNDIDFALLGSVAVADGDLTVTVDDTVTGAGGGNFVFSDAIAIGLVPEPSGYILALFGLLGFRWLSSRRR
jgi:hypothetical protein